MATAPAESLRPPAEARPASLSELGVLRCPACGEGYLHHRRVTVYSRAEDAETVRVITTDGRTTMQGTSPSAESDNPSARRGAVCIEFFCETCVSDDLLQLAIIQHKGNTYLEWVRW